VRNTAIRELALGWKDDPDVKAFLKDLKGVSPDHSSDPPSPLKKSSRSYKALSHPADMITVCRNIAPKFV
jgi:hypothetical protein